MISSRLSPPSTGKVIGQVLLAGKGRLKNTAYVLAAPRRTGLHMGAANPWHAAGDRSWGTVLADAWSGSGWAWRGTDRYQPMAKGSPGPQNAEPEPPLSSLF